MEPIKIDRSAMDAREGMKRLEPAVSGWIERGLAEHWRRIDESDKRNA